MIDVFTKADFEKALPNTVDTTWELIQGEHTYTLRITDEIFIRVRSSVKANGQSAGTGDDSIRAWLVDNQDKPLGSKVQNWVTRQPGWDERLLKMLRELWKRAQWAGYCPDCKIPMGVFKSKTKANPNRIFKKCLNEGCPHSKAHFEWEE